MALKIVILGGTKGIGRALARRLAARGDGLHLLGRDSEDLAKCAADLQARMPAPGPVTFSCCDLEDPDGFAAALTEADTALGGFDTAIITAGLFSTQPLLEGDLAITRRLLTVNYANTVLLCEHLRGYLLGRGGGTLCVFSSVAGDRGRKPVILYGSSKAGLSTYLEGLDHKFRAAGLKTRPWTVAIEGEVKKPRSFDLEEMQRDLEARDQLRPLLSRLRQVAGRADDTERALGNDLYESALAAYRFAKATDGSAVADALQEHGSERFASNGKRSPTPEDSAN